MKLITDRVQGINSNKGHTMIICSTGTRYYYGTANEMEKFLEQGLRNNIMDHLDSDLRNEVIREQTHGVADLVTEQLRDAIGQVYGTLSQIQ